MTLKHNYLTLHPLGIYPKDEENVKKQNINCFSVIIMLLVIYVSVLKNQFFRIKEINTKSKLSNIKFELELSFRTHDILYLKNVFPRSFTQNVHQTVTNLVGISTLRSQTVVSK